jgi:L-aspartate oxidase
MMGGISTDVDGRATLPGLHAVGECSCTGLHGANRLASNSLTECFVFGARAARSAVAGPGPDRAAVEELGLDGGAAGGRVQGGDRSPSGGPGRDPAAVEAPPPLSPASREALWRHAGLERDGPGLRELAGNEHPLVRLIATSALTRTESRGAHQRTDFPERDPRFDGRHVTIRAGGAPGIEMWE